MRSPTGTRPMLGSLGAKTSEFLRSLLPAWRLLGFEQRLAAAGSLLLIVSTFGPFTFVEAAEVLTALGVLLLLKRRAEGYQFHLPFGDGTVIAAAGVWCGLLILIRLFDRSLGQNLLALACAAIMFLAGVRERAKRPMDDLPPETPRRPRPADEQTEWLEADAEHTQHVPRDRERTAGDAERTERLARDRERTERLARDLERTERLARDAERTERLSEPKDRGSSPGSPPR
jgi:hypothetical protein